MLGNKQKFRFPFSKTLRRELCSQSKAAVHWNQYSQIFLFFPASDPQAADRAARQLTTALEAVIQPLTPDANLSHCLSSKIYSVRTFQSDTPCPILWDRGRCYSC